MLYEAWRMKPNEGEETQREVEEELARRGSTPSLVVEAGDQQQQQEEEEGEESSLQQQDSITTSHGPDKRARSLGQTIREKSWFGKKCVKIFRVFSNTFAMTFLAEWGDRSQV